MRRPPTPSLRFPPSHRVPSAALAWVCGAALASALGFGSIPSAQAAEPGAPAAAASGGWVGELARRIRLSGNADVGFLYGEARSRAPDGRWVIDNARLFLDADLVDRDDLPLEGWLDDASLYLEWDLYRHTTFLDDVGSLYVRLDHLAGSSALNVKVGRMAIPFGFEYPRWSEDRPANPLAGFSAAQPYGWDEGVELFGALADDRVRYQAALLDGDERVGVNTQATPSFAAKLTVAPLAWLSVSGSGYTSGKLGTVGHPVWSALIVASTPFPPLSANPYDPSYVDAEGEAEPVRLDGVRAWEADVVLDDGGAARVWLGYGQVHVDGRGEPIAGRRLQYGAAEGTLGLGVLAPSLDRLYLAARVSFIGTFDDRQGYLLNVDDDGFELGFDTQLVQITELGLGVRLTKHLTLKAEYAAVDFDLVDGAPAEARAAAHARGYGALTLAAGF
ncbi:MAG: hypothetical protein U0610_06705 [bacterium]